MFFHTHPAHALNVEKLIAKIEQGKESSVKKGIKLIKNGKYLQQLSDKEISFLLGSLIENDNEALFEALKAVPFEDDLGPYNRIISIEYIFTKRDLKDIRFLLELFGNNTQLDDELIRGFRNTKHRNDAITKLKQSYLDTVGADVFPTDTVATRMREQVLSQLKKFSSDTHASFEKAMIVKENELMIKGKSKYDSGDYKGALDVYTRLYKYGYVPTNTKTAFKRIQLTLKDINLNYLTEESKLINNFCENDWTNSKCHEEGLQEIVENLYIRQDLVMRQAAVGLIADFYDKNRGYYKSDAVSFIQAYVMNTPIYKVSCGGSIGKKYGGREYVSFSFIVNIKENYLIPRDDEAYKILADGVNFRKGFNWKGSRRKLPYFLIYKLNDRKWIVGNQRIDE